MRGVTRAPSTLFMRVIKSSWLGVETNWRSCWRTDSELPQVRLGQVVEAVTDSRNQPWLDTASADDDQLNVRDGCVSPRIGRCPGATR